MVSDIFSILMSMTALAFLVLTILWLVKKVFHKKFWQFLTGWIVLGTFIAVPIFAFVAGSTMTAAQQTALDKQDKIDAIAKKKARAASESSKRTISISESSRKVAFSQHNSLRKKAEKESSKHLAISKDKKASNAKTKQSSITKVASKAKQSSITKAASKAKQSSITKATSKAKQSSITKAASKTKQSMKVNNKKASAKQHKQHYKYIDLIKLTEDPYKYGYSLIKTAGTVVYIQTKPSDSNIYYVVIAPKDEYSSSGFSDGHGSVTEISVDTMKATPINKGDHITVYGSVLENMVKLNGKELKTDIIVDRINK